MCHPMTRCWRPDWAVGLTPDPEPSAEHPTSNLLFWYNQAAPGHWLGLISLRRKYMYLSVCINDAHEHLTVAGSSPG